MLAALQALVQQLPETLQEDIGAFVIPRNGLYTLNSEKRWIARGSKLLRSGSPGKLLLNPFVRGLCSIQLRPEDLAFAEQNLPPSSVRVLHLYGGAENHFAPLTGCPRFADRLESLTVSWVSDEAPPSPQFLRLVCDMIAVSQSTIIQLVLSHFDFQEVKLLLQQSSPFNLAHLTLFLPRRPRFCVCFWDALAELRGLRSCSIREHSADAAAAGEGERLLQAEEHTGGTLQHPSLERSLDKSLDKSLYPAIAAEQFEVTELSAPLRILTEAAPFRRLEKLCVSVDMAAAEHPAEAYGFVRRQQKNLQELRLHLKDVTPDRRKVQFVSGLIAQAAESIVSLALLGTRPRTQPLWVTAEEDSPMVRAAAAELPPLPKLRRLHLDVCDLGEATRLLTLEQPAVASPLYELSIRFLNHDRRQSGSDVFAAAAELRLFFTALNAVTCSVRAFTLYKLIGSVEGFSWRTLLSSAWQPEERRCPFTDCWTTRWVRVE